MMGFWDCVKELIDSELTERLRIYARAEYLGRQGNKPWLRYAAIDCADAADEIERLTAELDKTKEVIAQANNSLFGSYSFFLSTNGGADNLNHLSSAIENIKAISNKRWLRAEAAEARVRDLEVAGQFLLDRLSEQEVFEEMVRNWMGHVDPAVERFAAALKGITHD